MPKQSKVLPSQREKAKKELGVWLMDKARAAVRKNYPGITNEEAIDLLAKMVLDVYAREQFAKSAMGYRT
jgi:hypothetical protein